MSSESTREKKKTLLIVDSEKIKTLRRVPYAIKFIKLIENEIEIKISYTGGCKSHDFQLLVDRNLVSKLIKDINLNLSHDDNGDRCKKIVSENLLFDLSPLFKLIYPEDFKKNVKLYIDSRPIEKFGAHSN